MQQKNENSLGLEYGILEKWNNGILEKWNVGKMECWKNGMMG
jgi:hypothetical protein